MGIKGEEGHDLYSYKAHSLVGETNQLKRKKKKNYSVLSAIKVEWGALVVQRKVTCCSR